MRPLVSVLVPTRQRLSTLRSCIASCLAQRSPDFEVVIQDNASTDGTEAYVLSQTDRRLKYFRTPVSASMRTNFENAVGNAAGDYLIMIGDDDGLVPGGIDRLVTMCRAGEFDFVTWPDLWYHWPQFEGDRSGGTSLKRIDLFGCQTPSDGKLVRQRILAGERRSWLDEPRIYHGCVARRVVDKVQAATNKVFSYDIPDVYLQVAVSLLSARGLKLGHPVSIIGISPKSTGFAHFSTPRATAKPKADDPSHRFVTEAALDPPAVVPFNPAFISTDYYRYASLLIAGPALAPDAVIEHEAWIRRVVGEIAPHRDAVDRAMNAPVLSSLDEQIIDRLRSLPLPARLDQIAALPVAAKRRSKSKLLRKGRLCVAAGAPDDIASATSALARAGLDRHDDRPVFAGWQGAQALKWMGVLKKSWAYIVP